MANTQSSQQLIGDFYGEVVLPALAERLDTPFPEFGWERDGRGWVATNEEMTHRALGIRAERVVAHGHAPQGFLVGSLPGRYALEQEDAIRHVADRCGYSRAAVESAFRARYWSQPQRTEQRRARKLVMER